MRAIVCTKYGSPDVLQLKEVEKPIPRDNEILVNIYASTVTRGDVIIRKIPRLILLPMGMLFGFKAKKITGHEFSGEVEKVGKYVKSFKKGDQVFGTTTGLSCGGNAEFVCVPEKWKRGMVTKKPANTSFEEAVVVPIGGTTALQILRKGKIQEGQKVLIYGASGSVGTYAVQLAKYFGAEVTAVCSTRNLELAKSLGADNTIDYTKEDFTKSSQTYDIIFDAVRKTSSSRSKSSLKKNGLFLSVKSLTSEKTEDLNFLKELIEAGQLKSVIDKHYPLEQIVEAHRYVDKGHKRGNVVITMDHNNKTN